MPPRPHGTIDQLDTICFVHWSPRPHPIEVQRALDGVLQARRETGRPLIVVSIIPSDARVPHREGREALHRITTVLDRLCEAQYAVFQGTSIRARILRAFLVAIGLAMQSTQDVVADVETAVRGAAARLGVDPEVLIARAREMGIDV